MDVIAVAIAQQDEGILIVKTVKLCAAVYPALGGGAYLPEQGAYLHGRRLIGGVYFPVIAWQIKPGVKIRHPDEKFRHMICFELPIRPAVHESAVGLLPGLLVLTP